MGLFDVLLNVANAVNDEGQRRAGRYRDGYESGAARASQMSDAELRASLKRAKENGFSDLKDAGRVRAMADEYKNRK